MVHNKGGKFMLACCLVLGAVAVAGLLYGGIPSFHAGRNTQGQYQDISVAQFDAALKERDDRLAAALDQLKSAGADPAKLAELEAALQQAADAAEAERAATAAAITASTAAAVPADPAPAPADPAPVNPAAAQADAPVAPGPNPA